jgi:hypothetical protein
MRNHTRNDLQFDYVNPAPLNERVLLLERDGTVTVGPWKGPATGSNRRYMGWHPLPARNPALERAVA